MNGDKEMVQLLIGDAEKDGRRYAKLGKDDRVFLLSAKQSAMALTEYRSRKPWAALDAVQVDQIKYVGDEKSFTLKKRETDWSVAEKIGTKVNAKAVTDLLDAVAGLKVERYLFDAKGDLQLHGLQPAVLKIEISGGGSSRTLLVGRSEGDSARLYAAVAGSDCIFVLSEADARRIVKSLADFVEP